MKTGKKTKPDINLQPHAIVFGFDRKTDEQSLQLFLQRFTARKFLSTLLPRLHDEEITATVDFITSLMQKHLSEEEYHTLFLAEQEP